MPAHKIKVTQLKIAIIYYNFFFVKYGAPRIISLFPKNNFRFQILISLLPCIIILNIQRTLKIEICYNSNRIAGVSWGTMGTKIRT
jgi:hypothetical protein